jgi:hypothetical protein
MGYVLGAWNPPPHPPGEPDNASKARGAYSGGLGEGTSRPVPMKTRFPKWGALLRFFAGWLWKGLGSRWKPRPCGAAAMPRMPFSQQYTLSTTIVDGTGRASKTASVAASSWLAPVKVSCGSPSQLMVAATSLARAWALVMLMVAAYSVSSVAFQQCSLVSWASRARRSPMSSSCYWAAHHSALID